MSAIEEKIGDVFGATLSRRKLVKRGGALVVGLSVVGAAGAGSKAAKAATGTTLDPTVPSSWIEIRSDNSILMRTGKVELGQGSASTAYAQIVAEELNVPYSAITEVVMGDTDRTPDGGFSAGYMSGGSPNPRKVGAYVYQALLALASAKLGVPVSSLSVTNGVVSGGGKQVSYGQLVSGQQLNLTIPVSGSLQGLFGLSVTGNPPTKPIAQYQVIGQSIGMRTIPPIVSATAPPTNSGPRKLNTVARAIAWPGRAARVATNVAIAFAASWIPLVTANAIARATASASPASIARLYPGPWPFV